MPAIAARAAAAFPAWAALGPNARRAVLMKAAAALEARKDAVRRGDDGRDRRDRGLGDVQPRPRRGHGARGGGDHHADLGRGDPLGQAGLPRHGAARAGRRDPRHCAVERADHPRRARHRGAARLRQYGDPQGQRDLPAHPCADRRGLRRGGLPRRRGQHRHQRARGCRRGRRRADRRARGAADQLHRLDRGRQDHRQARGRAPQAGACSNSAARRR